MSLAVFVTRSLFFIVNKYFSIAFYLNTLQLRDRSQQRAITLTLKKKWTTITITRDPWDIFVLENFT